MKNFYGVKLSSAKIYMRYAISLHIYKYSESFKNIIRYAAFLHISTIILPQEF